MRGRFAYFALGVVAQCVVVLALSLALPTKARAVTYDDWYRLAAGQAVSPAAAAAGDLSQSWTAPDGRTIKAVVRQPANPAGPTVVLNAVPAGADARPYFDDLVARAVAAKASKLVIPPGTYRFRTLGNNAHWFIRRLNDATIVGTGATLLFDADEAGITVSECQRLKLVGLTLDYNFRTTSWGHMLPAPDKIHGVIQIDDPASVTAADGLGHIAQYDKATGKPDPADLRVYTTGAQWQGDGRYFSMGFGKNTIGKQFVVFHHYYGGTALKLLGDPMSGAKQTEDITIDRVRIVRSPGMGIVVSGVKRGVAITNSKIVPAAGEPISTEYDAIHILPFGGDLIVQGNTLVGAGDDNINLNSPVMTVAAVSGATVTLGHWSYFIRPGHVLMALDGDYRIIGSATVTGVPPQMDPTGNNAIALDRPIPGLSAAHFVWDAGLSMSRVAILNNSFTTGGKVLVQVANVLIQGNTFDGSGVRLTSNLGTFVEGEGALNVAVQANRFTGGKITNRYGFPFAAISAYAVTASDKLAAAPVHRWIAINKNTIAGVPQAAISIGSAANVRVAGNTASGTFLLTSRGADFNILTNADLRAFGNVATLP